MVQKLFYTQEQLEEMGVVDTTPRIIVARDKAEFRCECGETGPRQLSEAKKSKRLYGRYYRCKDCLMKTILAARGPGSEWHKKIIEKANRPSSIEHAKKIGKEKIKEKNYSDCFKYWEFSCSTDVANTAVVTGVCKECGFVKESEMRNFIRLTKNAGHGCPKCWESVSKSKGWRKKVGEMCRGVWSGLEPEERKKRIDRLVSTIPSMRSKAEEEVLQFVRQFQASATHTRIGQKEIDIYIPELKIGFEYDGLYWHSSAKKCDPNHHLNKMNHFLEHGIRVFNITSYEWEVKRKQTEYYILGKIRNDLNSIGARKLVFKEVPLLDARAFCQEYHIQGSPNYSDIAFGGYLDNELLIVGIFGRHHRNSEKTVLQRFITKSGHVVSGGLSKISKMGYRYFQRPIITWCDLRLFDGHGYELAGWEKEEVLKPDYFYTDGVCVISKQSRKKNAVNTPEGMTEREHAELDGLYRYYDCGKIRFVFDPSKKS